MISACLVPVASSRLRRKNSCSEAFSIPNKFAEYFSSPAGAVSWQHDVIWGTMLQRNWVIRWTSECLFVHLFLAYDSTCVTVKVLVILGSFDRVEFQVHRAPVTYMSTYHCCLHPNLKWSFHRNVSTTGTGVTGLCFPLRHVSFLLHVFDVIDLLRATVRKTWQNWLN